MKRSSDDSIFYNASDPASTRSLNDHITATFGTRAEARAFCNSQLLALLLR